jgi:hypothetical protein
VDERDVARLAAIGPFTVVSDRDAELVVTWSGLPALASPLGTFELKFLAQATGLTGRVYPHGQMYELWERWSARHTDFAAEIRVAVELEMEAAGITGEPAEHVASAAVLVSQLEDGHASRYYTVSAHVALRFGRRVSCTLDPESGRLKFQ